MNFKEIFDFPFQSSQWGSIAAWLGIGLTIFGIVRTWKKKPKADIKIDNGTLISFGWNNTVVDFNLKIECLNENIYDLEVTKVSGDNYTLSFELFKSDIPQDKYCVLTAKMKSDCKEDLKLSFKYRNESKRTFVKIFTMKSDGAIFKQRNAA
ncbi:hypothetical protein [Pedobacter gandavensis]|uniref:hypothetical protein n=1 Tax=Pedobacter gandavensis TaxID=2679963 RepID=UPI00293029F3|nr:hypothetical protein [Pedobacter gandavensis]